MESALQATEKEKAKRTRSSSAFQEGGAPLKEKKRSAKRDRDVLAPERPSTPPPSLVARTSSSSSAPTTTGDETASTEGRRASIQRSVGLLRLSIPAPTPSQPGQTLVPSTGTDPKIRNSMDDVHFKMLSPVKIEKAEPMADAASFLGGDLALAYIFMQLRALADASKTTWAGLREAAMALDQGLQPLCTRLASYELHMEVQTVKLAYLNLLNEAKKLLNGEENRFERFYEATESFLRHLPTDKSVTSQVAKSIDETEILLRIQHKEADKAESLRQLFFKLPKEAGDVLDKKECLGLFAKVHQIMGLPEDRAETDISEWWEFFDDNADGHLSWNEFKLLLRLVEGDLTQDSIRTTLKTRRLKRVSKASSLDSRRFSSATLEDGLLPRSLSGLKKEANSGNNVAQLKFRRKFSGKGLKMLLGGDLNKPAPVLPSSPSHEKLSAEEQTKLLSKRRNLVQEILATEEHYVARIGLIVKHFELPLTNLTRTDAAAFLTAEQVSTLFSNVSVVWNVNKVLLSSLRDVMDKWDDHISSLGHVFHNLAPFFVWYEGFVTNYASSYALLLSLIKENKKFRDFKREAEKQPGFKGDNLESLLILPIQRVPQYSLLLNDMLKATWLEHADHASIVAAARAVGEVASFLNEKTRFAESRQRVIELADKLGEPKLAANEDRRLICSVTATTFAVEGRGGLSPNLVRRSAERIELFLFSDLLAVAQIGEDKSLTLLDYGFFQKGSVRLMRSVVVDFIEWQLDLKQRSFFFTAESQPKMLELSTKVAEVVNSQQKEQEEQKSRTKVENKISKLVVKTSNKADLLACQEMISLARCSEPLWQRLLSQEDLRVSFLTTFTADQLKDLSHASYTAYVIKTNLELIAGISLWLSPSVEDKFSIVPLSKHLSLIRECLKLPSTGVDFGAIYSDLSRLLVESQPPNAWKLIAFEAAGAYNFQRSWDALVEPQLAEADRTGHLIWTWTSQAERATLLEHYGFHISSTLTLDRFPGSPNIFVLLREPQGLL